MPETDASSALAKEQVALFAERVAALPMLLVDLLRRPRALDLGPPASWVTTGVGASEGPARIFAHALSEHGRPARFAPLSAFTAQDRLPSADGLAVFSQSVSPNATIAIGAARGYERALLFTCADPNGAIVDGFSGAVCQLPSLSESGLLVRVQGPLLSAAAALMAVAATERGGHLRANLGRLAGAIERAVRWEPPDIGAGRRAVFVTARAGIELASMAANTWLEALLEPAPSVVDVLGYAHGPLQAHLGKPTTLFALRAADDDPRPFEALARVVAQSKAHALIEVTSTLPSPLAALEHHAAIAVFIAQRLAVQPRLMNWEAHIDAPLYELALRR